MYLYAFIIGCSFLYWYYKQAPTPTKLIDTSQKEFMPRRYRKWDSYDKKHEWSNRYMRYLMKCKVEKEKPRAIPSYRMSKTDVLRLETLQNIYEKNCKELNLNK